MESGNDITLETLDRIRMETREKEIPIHFDFHTLTLGIDKDSKRFRRPMTDWRRWCFMTTSVQLNEEEAAGLSAERFDENTLINHMMPLMVRALLITRHQKGVTLIRQESKKLKRFDIKGEEVNEVVETKGAGDVFGAAYIYQYLKTKNPLQSATFANLIASKKIQLRGTDELNRLTEMIRQYKNGGNSKPKTASEMKENAV
jgi:sugar/nucleoside kinase (ribokinase family)